MPASETSAAHGRARCACCTHPDGERINELLLSGTSHARISRDYGMSRKSITNHWNRHVPAQVKAASARARALNESTPLDSIRADVLLGQAAAVYGRAIRLVDDLDDDTTDQRARVSSLRELRGALRDMLDMQERIAKLPTYEEEEQRLDIDAAIVAELARMNPNQLDGDSGVCPMCGHIGKHGNKDNRQGWETPMLEAGS